MTTLKQTVRFIAEQSDEDMLGYRLMTITNAVVKAIVAVYVCGVIAGEFLTAVYATIEDAVSTAVLAHTGEPFADAIPRLRDV